MKHMLMGGQYDGEIVGVLHGDSVCLPKKHEACLIGDSDINPTSTEYDEERYTKRLFHDRKGERFVVFAHVDMTDDQVAKAIGL